MLKLADDTLVLAASDLTSHLACPHLTQQRHLLAKGERPPMPVATDPHAALIRARGEEHERAQLERLSEELGGFVDLSCMPPATTREAVESAVAATREAMREGAPLIYQAHFFESGWQGRVDFLRRVAGESALGDHSYEVLDTKLARQVKPHFVHQLCLYSRLLTSAQDLQPENAYVVLGDGSTAAVELRRYAALHRHVTAQLEQIASGPPRDTYPEPVAHCAICDLASECRKRLVSDDHLSLVASIRRENRDQLVSVGIPTVAALAAAEEPDGANLMGADRFAYLRQQAALQVESRESGQPTHKHLPPARAAGYAMLPKPTPGDVYFDLEGDPYMGNGGIEYLWGWWTADGYEHEWAHDSESEKVALERFVDRVTGLRREHPGMHVFHYAPHERAKLRALSIAYATRENEVDALLRGEVLVDLYAVVRQGFQVGEESYSLKALERHHAFERLEQSVREGGGSIVVYENWLKTGDPDLLDSIRTYNEEDCCSTRALREWLEGAMRPEAETEFGVDFSSLREPEDEEERGPPEWMPQVLELVDRLEQPRSADAEDDAAPVERELLANLLLYHHREGKPGWWRYFDLRGKPVRDLIDDRDALAGLERVEDVPPTPYKRSLDYVFSFPAQEFRLDTGDAEDPTTGEGVNVVAVNADRVVLRRGKNKPPPDPVALIGGSPINVSVLREALIELAEVVLVDGVKEFTASRELLRGAAPRLSSGEFGEDVDSLVSAVLGLDRSVLPVQGPPGTGKTWRAARAIAAALAAGRRVGVTAPSHAAIQNVLCEVEEYAHTQGQDFSAIYKGSGYESPHGMIESTETNGEVTTDHQLVAGTAWLFARPEHRRSFDLILVDEAGQFPLANAVAVGLASENLVLLGDPQQLPQVTQAEHPQGSGASVLGHILAGEKTIPPNRGILLTESWRMHPEVCAFVSERSYDGRLRSREACAQRQVTAPVGGITGVGLRALAMEHEGRSQASPEEAEAIAAACRDLLAGSTVTDDHGRERPLEATDILVVAPYNLAVRQIRERVPADVRVGTVDRFQGQQAPVVFYAMTCSAGEDVPRGMEFLFDSHRLNVAVSRAQCLAVLVHSPRLLDADCPTLEAMELVDGVCRFVELATPVTPSS